MEKDDIQNLVKQVTKEIKEKASNPNKKGSESSISIQCQFCDDGLVIDGFCMNCGEDNE